MLLNGWRRLGAVLVGAWLMIATVVLWNGPELVLQNFPELGVQKMGTYPVAAPELRERLEAEKVQKLGRELKPWEMEWNPVRNVPVVIGTDLPQITRFVLLFGFPAALWFLTEALAAVAIWVKRYLPSHRNYDLSIDKHNPTYAGQFENQEDRVNQMKIVVSVVLAGLVIAVALYAGLTDDRRTYMKACTATAKGFGQSAEAAENNCALRYKG